MIPNPSHSIFKVTIPVFLLFLYKIFFIEEGATTCFEAWGKDQKANTSLCHPWASAPISVIAEDILPTMPWLGEIKYNLS